MGAAAGVVVGGIGSELSGGTFSQGAMLAAMNAVTVWAIEQSTASEVKTGGEVEKTANKNMNTNWVLLAEAQTEGTVIDTGGGYIQLVMGHSAAKITGYLHSGEIIFKSGKIALEAGAAFYEGIKYLAIDDCRSYIYSEIPYHKHQGFQNVDWKTIPGNTCEEKFINLQKQ